MGATGGLGAGGFEPPALRPQTWEIYWKDPNSPVSDFMHVTGSRLDPEAANLLSVFWAGGGAIINVDEVRFVRFYDEDDR